MYIGRKRKKEGGLSGSWREENEVGDVIGDEVGGEVGDGDGAVKWTWERFQPVNNMHIFPLQLKPHDFGDNRKCED
jgi:hypothetical protein